MAAIKHLVNLDMSKNQLLNAVVQNLAVAPSSPVEGQIYWDTAVDSLFVWNAQSSAWIDLGSSGVTNLSYTTGASSGVVVSSTGTNATLPAATTSNAGLMSSADKTKLNAVDENAEENVATNLAESGATTTTVKVTSSTGTDATLNSASTSRAGLMSKAKFDQVEVNNNKVSDINHNVSTNLSTTQNTTTVVVNSSDGNNATISSASTSQAGVMTKAIYDEHLLNNAKVSNVPETVTSMSLSSNILTYTDEDGNDTDLDLSLYLDDTNLARLTSGTINSGTGIATFTRDDNTTFTVDMSAFLDAITLNNTLVSTSTTQGLTANMGKTLKDLIDTINSNNTGSNTGDEVQATTTTKGIAEIATQTEVNSGSDNSRIVTPLTLKSTLGITSSLSTTLTYSDTIGNGSSTSIAVTHSIGNQYVQASVYEVSSTDQVMCEIELTSSTVTTFKFNTAPTTNQYRVVIIG